MNIMVTLNNPNFRTAAETSVVAGTGLLGADLLSVIELTINPVMQAVGVFFGLILTTVLIYKSVLEVRIKKRALKEMRDGDIS